MKIFDDKTNQIKTSRTQTGNNWDIFDPSVYTLDISKFRTEYIRSISAKIAEVIASVDDGEGDPNVEVILTGDPTNRTIELRFHNLKGTDGVTPELESIIISLENMQNALSSKASDTEFQTLKNLVYSLHSSGNHTYSPNLYFKNSRPTLNFTAALKIGNENAEITSEIPYFIKGNEQFNFTKSLNSTSKTHIYKFEDTNGILDDSINFIDVAYDYKSTSGIRYNGSVRYRGVSVVYFGKSNVDTLTQESAQSIINTLNKSQTPVSTLVTTLDLYSVYINSVESANIEEAPFFYFAVPEDVTPGIKFYVKGGSAQFASDLVYQGTYSVNVDDICGQRTVNYKFYRSSARQGAGNFIIYVI